MLNNYWKCRALIAETLTELSEEQLLKVPTGFNNNILWNAGHIVVTQQLLHYRVSGLDPYIPSPIIERYKTDTSPDAWKSSPSIDKISHWLENFAKPFFCPISALSKF